MSLPPLQSDRQYLAIQTRTSPNIADMAGTIKAVLKTFFTLMERSKLKTKIKTEKIHKKNQKKNNLKIV